MLNREWYNFTPRMAVVAACLIVTACGASKFNFVGIQQFSKQKKVPAAPEKDSHSNPETLKTDTIKVPDEVATNTDNLYIDAKETFQISASDRTPSDLVFVVDGSGSMSPLINRFIEGFERIPSEKYPPNSRLAVMNMISSDPEDINKPLVERVYQNNADIQEPFRSKLLDMVKAEPGYLRFVQKQEIQNFKSLVNKHELTEKTWGNVKWGEMLSTHEACDTPWFEPVEKNTSQKSCLRAAMQITGVVGVESGLLAIAQLMQKNATTPLFRENAAVHFILISDTHDPGHSDFFTAEYRNNIRPKFSQINSAVRLNSTTVKQVKIHGVVPKENACAIDEHRLAETPYIPEILASGGVLVDACDASLNYESVVTQLFYEAKKIPAFVLNASSVRNVSVKVNGQSSNNFRVIGDNSVELNDLLTPDAHTIEISYSKPR